MIECNQMTTQTKEGFRRLLWEADLTFLNFGVFQRFNKHFSYERSKPNWLKYFYTYQKINHGLWGLYWRVFKVKNRRIGYI